ncbi:hypothetical protein CVT24_010709 [Panaeolus cyanescens]|uniref:Uncharacterized protein n=1 Tax=Panaeolus cyanescens TaxID=181874 RepID=A0A409YW00_9AGAR|nr:hypothetical protein CVT24_010709 [Panaeolus cyanescens]
MSLPRSKPTGSMPADNFDYQLMQSLLRRTLPKTSRSKPPPSLPIVAAAMRETTDFLQNQAVEDNDNHHIDAQNAPEDNIDENFNDSNSDADPIGQTFVGSPPESRSASPLIPTTSPHRDSTVLHPRIPL